MSKSFVVGIAGGSGTGKTSLATGLAKSLGLKTVVLHLDDYFVSKDKVAKLAGEDNWDHPSSIDGGKLMKELNDLINRPDRPEMIIIEGFMLLHFSDIRETLDLKIFLDMDFYKATMRRVHPMWDNYRENVLKPMYEEYVAPSSKFADTIYDAGRLSQQEVLNSATELIKSGLADT